MALITNSIFYQSAKSNDLILIKVEEHVFFSYLPLLSIFLYAKTKKLKWFLLDIWLINKSWNFISQQGLLRWLLFFFIFHSMLFSVKCSCQIASKLMWSFRHTWAGSYLRSECNFCFFANALFSASGDNLGLKRTSNSCKQVASAAEFQKKPKCCRVEYLI